MIQKKLIWNPVSASPPASAARTIASRAYPPATVRKSTVSAAPGLARAAAEEDREDAHDDREDAEALGERRADDERGPDLGGRVRVAPDRAGRHAGQDADADAGTDDAERREAGSDLLHGCWFLLLGPVGYRVMWARLHDRG